MKIGISSYAFRFSIGTKNFKPEQPLSPLSFIEKAVAMGAEAIQICDNFNIGAMSDREIELIREKAGKTGVTVELGMGRATFDSLRRYLSSATLVGAGVVRSLLETGNGKCDKIEYFRTLKGFQKQLHRSGIVLALENHFQLKPDELLEIVTQLDDPQIRVCLDPLNSLRLLVGPDEVIRLLGPVAVSAHIKDVKVVPGRTGFSVTGCPLGEGLLDTHKLFMNLNKRNEIACLHLESWMDPLDNAKATIAQEEEWIRKGMAHLRHLRKSSET